MIDKELKSYVMKSIVSIIITGVIAIGGTVWASIETTKNLNSRVELIERQIELQSNSINLIRLEMSKKVDQSELTECLKDLKTEIKETLVEIKTDIRELRKEIK